MLPSDIVLSRSLLKHSRSHQSLLSRPKSRQRLIRPMLLPPMRRTTTQANLPQKVMRSVDTSSSSMRPFPSLSTNSKARSSSGWRKSFRFMVSARSLASFVTKFRPGRPSPLPRLAHRRQQQARFGTTYVAGRAPPARGRDSVVLVDVNIRPKPDENPNTSLKNDVASHQSPQISKSDR